MRLIKCILDFVKFLRIVIAEFAYNSILDYKSYGDFILFYENHFVFIGCAAFFGVAIDASISDIEFRRAKNTR